MSRELDAKVAEKVMGWWAIMLPADDRMVASGIPPKEGHEREGVPHYSTSIEAAWEVVEKMHQEWWFTLVQGPDGWLADFYNDMDVRHRAKAKTAPEAICLAALKAVGA